MRARMTFVVTAVVLSVLSACSPSGATPAQSLLAAEPLDSAEAYLARGDNYAGAEAYEQAIRDYDAAIRLKPDYAEAYNNRGYAYYWKGDAASAIADYTRALELRPMYAYAYNNRGAAYMASGHPAEAIQDLNRALELQPDFPQAYTNRGNAYLRQGRLSEALADFKSGGHDMRGLVTALAGLAVLGGVAVAMALFRLVRRPARQPSD